MSMRRLLLPLLVLSLMLGACESQAQNDVGVIDLGRVLRDSEPGKAAGAFLEKIQKDFNDKIAAQQAKVQKSGDDKKERQILETMFMGMQTRLNTEEQNVTNTLIEHILQTAKTFRQQKKLRMLVRSEAVVDSDPACDVTAEFLDEVNKLKIEFKPVTQDPPAAPEEVSSEAAPAPKATEEQKPEKKAEKKQTPAK